MSSSSTSHASVQEKIYLNVGGLHWALKIGEAIYQAGGDVSEFIEDAQLHVVSGSY